MKSEQEIKDMLRNKRGKYEAKKFSLSVPVENYIAGIITALAWVLEESNE